MYLHTIAANLVNNSMYMCILFMISHYVVTSGTNTKTKSTFSIPFLILVSQPKLINLAANSRLNESI